VRCDEDATRLGVVPPSIGDPGCRIIGDPGIRGDVEEISGAAAEDGILGGAPICPPIPPPPPLCQIPWIDWRVSFLFSSSRLSRSDINSAICVHGFCQSVRAVNLKHCSSMFLGMCTC
jgi:hypothetical protein